MWKFKQVRGKAFGEQRVRADGTEFVDCQFHKTTLVYRGGAPFFVGGFRDNLRVEFEGAAADTLKTLRLLYHSHDRAIAEKLIAGIYEPFED